MLMIIESDNAEFFENIYPYKTESESTSERLNDHEKNQWKIF